MDDFDLYDAWLDSALTWAGRWKRAAREWRKVALGHRERWAEIETLRARNHYLSNENGGLRSEMDRLREQIEKLKSEGAPSQRAFEERDAAMQDRAVIKGRLTEALKEIERLRHALNLSRGEVGNLQTTRDKLTSDLEATRRALEGAVEKAKAADPSDEMAEAMEKMQEEINAWRRVLRAVLGEYATTNPPDECLKEITRRVMGLK